MFHLVALVVAVAVALTSCSFPANALVDESTTEKKDNAVEMLTLKSDYEAAINDAKNPEYDEISKELTAINKYNKELIWEGEPGESQVWVATWTREKGNGVLNDNKDQEIFLKKDEVKNTEEQYIWVTVVPELHNFCYEYMHGGNRVSDLKLRLKQKLGLRPGSGKDRIVEIAVDPKDLFRPSKDPEITDSQAELDYPRSIFFINPEYKVEVDPQYKNWFEDNIRASYVIKRTRQPWTQLGYTYDWGNNSSEIGLSEFVIKPGSTIKIKRIATTENYCAHKRDAQK